jgi:hypothetical protein
MKKMTATNWTSKTAVSGAVAPRRSPPTFPAMINPNRLRDAALARASLFPNIPSNPTTETIKIAGACNPKKTIEGIAKTTHGTMTR